MVLPGLDSRNRAPGRKSAVTPLAEPLPAVAIALASPLHQVAEERLFWVHMVQHLLLGDLAALAIVLGLDGRLLLPVADEAHWPG
jgi:cytochrome c oxidase assembly factor CtaG